MDAIAEEEIPDSAADLAVQIEDRLLQTFMVRNMCAIMVKLTRGELAMRIAVWRVNRKLAIVRSQDARALNQWRGSIDGIQALGSACDAVVHLDDDIPGLVSSVSALLESTAAPCTPRIQLPPEDDWGSPNLPTVSFHALQLHPGPEYETLCTACRVELAKRNIGAFSEGSLGVKDKREWLQHMSEWAPAGSRGAHDSPMSPTSPKSTSMSTLLKGGRFV